MPLEFNELCQLLTTIAQTDISELTLKTNDFELTIRKQIGVSNQQLPGGATLASLGSELTTVPTTVAANARLEVPSQVADTAASATEVKLSVGTLGANEQKFVEVISPMVGTFYRSPSPGESPFVEVGDRIKVGQTVCIIEAMKLMNEIEAEVSGQVIEVLLQNGEPVEYGQALLLINPE